MIPFSGSCGKSVNLVYLIFLVNLIFELKMRMVNKVYKKGKKIILYNNICVMLQKNNMPVIGWMQECQRRKQCKACQVRF